MWKEVESRKADKTGIEKARRKGRKNNSKNNRRKGGRRNNNKNNGRKEVRRGRFDRVEGNR